MKARVKRACELLQREYGVPRRPSRKGDLTSMLVRAILSQNTNDANRDRAFEGLRAAFPTWDLVANASLREIARAIRVGGLANQKGAAIRNFLRSLKGSHGTLDLGFLRKMTDEQVYDFLCGHKGIGVKTASIVLCFGCGRDVFPVDTHVNRLCVRLGLVPPKSTPDKTHELMGGLLPKGKSYSFHLNLIRLGKTVCTARNPRHGGCPLRRMCPTYRVIGQSES